MSPGLDLPLTSLPVNSNTASHILLLYLQRPLAAARAAGVPLIALERIAFVSQ